jgi:hypothetical protein
MTLASRRAACAGVMRWMLVPLATAAPALGASVAPRPTWTVYADCAGAYVANARVADPDRPATMVGQMSDVAEDYAKFARARYRSQRKASAEAASRAVAARIEATAASLSAQPRNAAEKVIDACPQTDG